MEAANLRTDHRVTSVRAAVRLAAGPRSQHAWQLESAQPAPTAKIGTEREVKIPTNTSIPNVAPGIRGSTHGNAFLVAVQGSSCWECKDGS